jgi:hypothetical protein
MCDVMTALVGTQVGVVTDDGT